MNIEDELKHKACNIELFAKKAVEDVEALEQYSGWLLNRANQVQMEMEILREKNKKLMKALTFYAELDGNGIQLYGEMDSKALEFIDGNSQPFGTIARDALKG